MKKLILSLMLVSLAGQAMAGKAKTPKRVMKNKGKGKCKVGRKRPRRALTDISRDSKQCIGSFASTSSLGALTSTCRTFAQNLDLSQPTVVSATQVSKRSIDDAARVGNLAIFKALWQNNMKNPLRDRDVNGVFWTAARHQNFNIVSYLLLNPRNGITILSIQYALDKAARYGYIDIVRLLINSIDERIEASRAAAKTKDAFLLAAKNGHTNIVVFLFNRYHYKSINGGNIEEIIENGHTDIAQFILNRCPHVYDAGNLLILAAKNGHTKIVKLILDKHSNNFCHTIKNILRGDKEGYYWLCVNNHIVTTILTKSLDLAVINNRVDTAILFAQYRIELLTRYNELLLIAQHDRFEMVKSILARNPDLNLHEVRRLAANFDIIRFLKETKHQQEKLAKKLDQELEEESYGNGAGAVVNFIRSFFG